MKNNQLGLANSSSIRCRGLTATQLKGLAIGLMFLDHFSLIALTQLGSVFTGSEISVQLFHLLVISFRLIGRLAFPIFAYLIVNGFLHTSNRKRYLMRLIAFAFISEPFFDFAIFGSWFNGTYQNVMGTLALGLVAIWGKELLSEKELPIPLTITPLLLSSFSAELLHLDYGFYGVMSIFLMYCFFNDFKQLVAGMVLLHFILYGHQLGCWMILLIDSITQLEELIARVVYCLTATAPWFSLFSLVILKQYNGKKGYAFSKYFFYFFYPLHLLALKVLVLLLT